MKTLLRSADAPCRRLALLPLCLCLLWLFSSTTATAATITVNSPVQVANPGPAGNGDGLCQLSEAIQAANTDLAVDGCAAGSGADIITLPAGTYVLVQLDNTGLNSLPFGLPVVTTQITIQGAAADTTIIERDLTAGTPDFALLGVQDNGGILVLNDLTLRNSRGAGNGGAVVNLGELTVNRCWFQDNATVPDGSHGGAIAAGAHGATVAHSVFQSNSAAGGAGGAIFGPATITDSWFDSNVAASGGAVACLDCLVTISDSTFSTNSAVGEGGALAAVQVDVLRTLFRDNSAGSWGGAIGLIGTSSQGIVRDSYFDSNYTTDYWSSGGAIAGYGVAASGSSFFNNVADNGGAFYGSGSIRNSVFSSNTATWWGGAIWSLGLTVNNATIVGNTGYAGGLYGPVGDQVSNSIIYANHDWEGLSPDCLVSAPSAGHNIIGDPTGCAWIWGPGDQIRAYPELSWRIDNAGVRIGASVGGLSPELVLTPLLLKGSPAVDAGDPATPGSGGTSCEATDIRGITRPVDAACDIGAAEGAVDPIADISVLQTDVDPVGTNTYLRYDIEVSWAGPDPAANVVLTDVLPAGTTFLAAYFYPGSSGSCSESGGLVTCHVYPPSKVSIRVQSPSTPGTITNYVSVSSDSMDPDTSNNSSTEQTTVTSAQEADLSVKVSNVPPTTYVGADLSCTLEIRNAGPQTADVVLTDPVPAGLSFVSAPNFCTYAGGTVTCPMTISPGFGYGFNVVLRAISSGTITNTFTASSNMSDPNPANNTAAVTTVVSPPETTAPTVSLTTPANGTTVSGSVVSVSASATDNVGVVGVQFKLDGANLGAEDTAPPYSLVWDTTQAANGPHTLTADARDAAGNHGTASVTVTIDNPPPPDTTAPTVAITSPASGSVVSGTSVTLVANATDNVGVVGVQFKLDGANLNAEDTAAPYSLGWDTTQVANGTHTITADARDAAGLHGSATVTVTVNNAPPPDTTAPTVTITSPASGSVVLGTSVTLVADATDNVGLVGVQFKLDGANLGAEDTAAPYSLGWDTTQVANGTHTITADARDAAGNHGTASVTVTIDNAPPPDTTAPTVAITSPASGSVVSGTSVTLVANATDNVGVVGVQFKVDGANLGAEDTTAPYALAWDTTKMPNGVHTLTVSARDAAGNVAVSVALTVTVNNSTEFAMGPTPGSPTSLAVVAGGTVTFKLNVAPTAGFAGPISFTCTGAPQFSTCAISPNPANVSGTTPTQITVTVTTTAKSSRTPSPLASGVPPTRRIAFAWATLFLPGIVFLRGAKLRRRGAPLLVAMVLVLSILFGCGGGSGPQIIIDDFTRLGTYPITITGTSGSVSHSFNLTLTVN